MQWTPSLYSQFFGEDAEVFIASQVKGLKNNISIFPIISSQGTSGSQLGGIYFDFLVINNVTEHAKLVLKNVIDSRILKEAETIIELIDIQLVKEPFSKKLPPLRAFQEEDGSLLIEWIFKGFRVGFSLEVEPEENGWYLVSKPSMGAINASGLLYGINLQRLIVWLIKFVTSMQFT